MGETEVGRIDLCSLSGVPKGGLMVGVIFRWIMDPIIIEYSTDYYGVHFTDRQLRLLRRISSDQALPVRALIKSYIKMGFKNTGKYKFSQGG